MAITLELDSPQDMLAKARREQTRLRQAIADQNRTQIADAIFNFAVTAYHIKDWLKEGTSGSYKREEVEPYVSSVPVLRICGEICNASKHRKLRDPAKHVEAVTASAATAVSPMTPPSEGVSLEAQQGAPFRMKVVALDGSRIEVMDFSAQVITAWEQFFTSHGLPPA